MNKIFYLILFHSIPFSLFSQTISGRIENIKHENISFVKLIFKDSINAVNINDYLIVRNGNYSITLNKKYKKLFIEVSANNYQTNFLVIDSFNETKKYVCNFILLKDTVEKLKEIIVTSKAPSFQIKGDTTSYNVSAYTDGTEKKIQEIIKKLPGIEINDKTGEIKYKGKSIETVKLDGDDLFASNYSIGTKNINVDMIEKVQVIENYSDNPILKGIEVGNKVALNLSVKKNKTENSGTIDLGLGLLGSNIAIDGSMDILRLSKKFKSFATVTYNNIGVNNSPFDYFSYSPSIEQLRQADNLAIKCIPDTYLNTDIDFKRSNINNLFFFSYNTLFKIGKNVSIKGNLSYLGDKITSIQKVNSKYLINGQNIETSDEYKFCKKPYQVSGDFLFKYNISKNKLLDYSLYVKNENINTINDLTQNYITKLNTNFVSLDNYFKQIATFTTKLSDKKALQINIKHTLNSIPQNIGFSPSFIDTNLCEQNSQKCSSTKSKLTIESSLLGSNSRGKYTLLAGSFLKNVTFNSELVGINSYSGSTIRSFINSFKYSQNSFYITSNYNFQIDKFKITPSVTISSLNQRFVNKLTTIIKDTSNFLFETSLELSYKINNLSAILFTTSFKQKPFSEEYLVDSPVYISNRISKENQIDLQIQNTTNVSIYYLKNNLFKQFQLNFAINYLENKGNYFSNLFIDRSSIKTVYFFLPEQNKQLSLFFLFEKYFSFLKGTIRIKNNFSKQIYHNVINGSSLRNNVNNNINTTLFYKTAFDGKINFQNTFEIINFQSSTANKYQYSNQSICNNFELLIKPIKSLFVVISTDYYVFSKSKNNNNNYFFFDSEITYRTKKKKFDFRISAKNLLNIKALNQIEINDYSMNNFETSLLPRQIIIKLSRNL